MSIQRQERNHNETLTSRIFLSFWEDLMDTDAAMMACSCCCVKKKKNQIDTLLTQTKGFKTT